jgi:VCBS repeat-containing protein
VTASGAGSWSYTLTEADVANMGQGPETLTVSATDKAGNVSPLATKPIQVDTVAPSAPQLAEQGSNDLGDGWMSGAEAQSPTFRVSLPTNGSLAVAGDKVELLIGGLSFQTPKVATLGNGDILAGRVDFTVLGTELGADGPKSLSAVVTDVAGNRGEASAVRAFVLDTQAPSLPLIDAVAGDDIINASETSASISGTAEASASIGLTVAGNLRTLTANAQGQWTYALTQADLNAMGQGSEAISVTAADAAGNVSNPATRTITIDTVAPASPTLDEQGSDDLEDDRMNAAEAVSTTFRVTLPTAGSKAVVGDRLELLLGGSVIATPKVLAAGDLQAGVVNGAQAAKHLGESGNLQHQRFPLAGLRQRLNRSISPLGR